MKCLVQGDHFGEISLLYDCPRTATINSRNYNTIAVLSAGNFNELKYDFPLYQKYLKKHSYTYKYSEKSFLKNIISRVEYLQNLTVEQFHEFIYTLRVERLEADEVLYHENDQTNDLIFIQSGYLEMYTYIDGNKFVLDILTPGTILN